MINQAFQLLQVQETSFHSSTRVGLCSTYLSLVFSSIATKASGSQHTGKSSSRKQKTKVGYCALVAKELLQGNHAQHSPQPCLLQSVHLLPHVVEVGVLQGLLRRNSLRRFVLQHFLQQTNTSKNSNLRRYNARIKSTEPSA